MFMVTFLAYNLKVAILLAVFYMFYRLLLSRDTLHRLNRIVLLTTAALSFILPLCVITLHKTVNVDESILPMTPTLINTQTSETEPYTPLWQQLAVIIYIIGMCVALCHTVISIFKVNRLIRRSEQHWQSDGTVITVTENAEIAPFSWMRHIVMNRKDFEEHDSAIIAHEKAHVKYRHSADVIFIDLVASFQWFNPTLWMLCADLRSIHEYEADKAVISQGINARQYQYLLIKKAVSRGGYFVVNSFNHSTLKNRITMMLRKKSSTNNVYKCLFILPIVAVTLALEAKTVTDFRIIEKSETAKADISKVVKTNQETNYGTDNVVEPMMSVTETEQKRNSLKKRKNNVKVIKAENGITDISDDNDYFIDGKAATASEVKKIKTNDIESVNVTNTNDKKRTIRISLKMRDESPEIFVDVKQITKAEFDNIKSNDIKSIEVKKSEGKNGHIYITMKSKEDKAEKTQNTNKKE